MGRFLVTLLAVFGLANAGAETAVDMQKRFGPSQTFSLMVPSQWTSGLTEGRFVYGAPDNGPSLQGTAWRIVRQPPLKEFSDIRYEGVLRMGIYKQVGEEQALAQTGGVLREYEGVWPGETHVTYYVVACANAGDVYAAIALVTTKDDYNANRPLYEKILATLSVYSAHQPTGSARE